ncbi:MAG: hypothetical protein KDB99_16025, partial [Chitinophagaceae bacterium]|nr:hypothetical protein [Chitinophagaceae bacterium]
AVGAGIGAGIYDSAETAMNDRQSSGIIHPENVNKYNELYGQWKNLLLEKLADTVTKKEKAISLS